MAISGSLLINRITKLQAIFNSLRTKIKKFIYLLRNLTIAHIYMAAAISIDIDIDGTSHTNSIRHLHQHFVTNNDRRIISQDMNRKTIGYNHARTELSASITAKWMPTERLGLSVTLREEMYGDKWVPLIPAFFIDGILSKKGNIVAKASVSRNYRFPTLNDLYFLPGGNTDLVPESGFSYDGGISFAIGKEGVYSLHGEAT